MSCFWIHDTYINDVTDNIILSFIGRQMMSFILQLKRGLIRDYEK